MKEKHLIGFSLSLCIQDILRGLVDIDEVLHIVIGCNLRNAEELEEQVYALYRKTYWKENPERALEIARLLDADRRIAWLADFRKSAPNIGWGHWLDVETGNVSREKLTLHKRLQDIDAELRQSGVLPLPE